MESPRILWKKEDFLAYLLIYAAQANQIETVEEIKNRIKQILNYIELERLIAGPDCGLGHLSRELAKIKLKRLVEAVSDL